MEKGKEFLQSEAWAKLQTAAGHEAVRLADGFSFMHTLPIVGKYLYTPRFSGMPVSDLVVKAKEVGARWVRIEPETEELLAAIKKEVETQRLAQDNDLKIVKAPHDMQPREVFVIDISKNEEELLAYMKPKTRYNIRLAEKHGVEVFESREQKYVQAFLDLITVTAERKDIVPHPRSYYEKFFTELPEDMCRLFVAKYEGVVIAANLVMVYGDTATYLHGGSGDQHREVMAPFLLQWEQIRWAKSRGYRRYDFGGVKTETPNSSWKGITRFKLGFSPQTAPIVFPGCYDIVIDTRAYRLYKTLGRFKNLISFFRKR